MKRPGTLLFLLTHTFSSSAVIAQMTPPFDPLAQQASGAFRVGQYRQSEVLWRQRVQQTSNEAAAYQGLGAVLLQWRKTAAAILRIDRPSKKALLANFFMLNLLNCWSTAHSGWQLHSSLHQPFSQILIAQGSATIQSHLQQGDFWQKVSPPKMIET